jgi:hypothetical protein
MSLNCWISLMLASSPPWFICWKSWPILLRAPSPPAPPDDEPVTEEDRRRFQEGQNWFARRDGKGIPMADVLADKQYY